MASRLALCLGCLLVACSLMTAVTASALKCRQEGRFAHPEDCGSYVDCLQTADSGLVAREGNCQGYPFSAEKRRCVDHSEKPDCVTKGTRGDKFPAPDFNSECAEGGEEVGCVNCKLAYTCISGNALIEVCDNSVCDTAEAFGGSVCLSPSSIPDSSSKDFCSCEKIGSSADPYNSTYYHYCKSAGVIPEMYSCPTGLVFKDDICEVDKENAPPEIPSCEGKSGTFVNPNNCNWFYTCLPGGIVRGDSCPLGEYFDQTNRECKLESLLNDVKVLADCSGIGNYPHEDDCTKYLFCTKLDEKPEVLSCQDGLFYDVDKKRCSDIPRPENCEEEGFDYSTCPSF